MPVPQEIQDLLDPGKDRTPYKGPLYWLWVFDPMTGAVHIEHNEDRPPAHHLTHKDIASEATHPNRLEGYAFHIRGGFRILTVDGKAVDDPYITDKIVKELKS